MAHAYGPQCHHHRGRYRLVNAVLARGDCVIDTARSLNKTRSLPAYHAYCSWISLRRRIDVLVNNAGYGAKALVEEAGSAEIRRQYEVFLAELHASVCNVRHIVMIGSRTSWRPELTTAAALRSAPVRAPPAPTQPADRARRPPFGIRMLIVESAAFRTDALIGNAVYTGNASPDYDVMRVMAVQRYKDTHKALRGDPAKAMAAVVDVVRGEGPAAGKPWPLYLVLGDLGVSGVAEKCERVLHLLDEWKEVSTGLDIDPEEAR
ncbi:NAD-P-binding protein [Mycena belliarum]|uniref:NAD-P-binding protein n=1 Tax=Mycena belliarum TaxID=1033014 RepID=A0AAD6U5Y3_9AGAR|nr:NAD-P-binding protein [Mycena belliae]